MSEKKVHLREGINEEKKKKLENPKKSLKIPKFSKKEKKRNFKVSLPNRTR